MSYSVGIAILSVTVHGFRNPILCVPFYRSCSTLPAYVGPFFLPGEAFPAHWQLVFNSGCLDFVISWRRCTREREIREEVFILMVKGGLSVTCRLHF